MFLSNFDPGKQSEGTKPSVSDFNLSTGNGSALSCVPVNSDFSNIPMPTKAFGTQFLRF